jgi:glutathione synthase/RimK-type ligase-like ATP-grasp enzyme
MLNKKQIVLLHGKNNFFGQTRKPWVSLDLDKICSLLEESGFNVVKYDYHKIINEEIEIRNSIVFYSFSQRENVRDFIKDLIHHLIKLNNVVIPSYDLLLCHENKGYQELYKKQIGINSLKCQYFNDKYAINYSEINYPSVLKKIDGSNGKGVYLVNNENELKKKLKSFESIYTLTKLDLKRRKYLRGTKNFEHYPNYNNAEDYNQYRDHVTIRENFILQDFVPDLKYDYRVLVIYDRYFVTRRFNKENDFRASGAKKYDFSFEIDIEMLEYSKQIITKINTPFLSIDLCKSNGKYYLLEYQAIHFGINVVVKSKGYYREENSQWIFVKNKNVIEEEMAFGLASYINNKIS